MKLRNVKAGDAVESVLKKTGIHQLVKALTKGKDCGCEKRKQRMNEWGKRRSS